MKVFVSWSGARSHAVANLVRTWTKRVIQSLEPWGSQEIQKGSLWFTEISDKLHECPVGIICLTHENKNAPWILFEAGALAKGLSSNRICTLLIDLQPSDVKDPLSHFNHANTDRDGMWELIKTLNGAIEYAALGEVELKEAFDTYWPKFDEEFNAILAKHPISETEKKKDIDDPNELIKEILENTRTTNRLITQRKKDDRGPIFNDVENTIRPKSGQPLIKEVAFIYAREGDKFDDVLEELHRQFPQEEKELLMSFAAEAINETRKDIIPF